MKIIWLCSLILVADAYPTHSRLNYKAHMSRAASASPEYTMHSFNQTLDHFNVESAAIGTFQQRYLVTNGSWAGPGSPIFVFTGAEGGDITTLYGFAYGHAVTVAKRLGGLIVFLEHRFFGASLPFGPVDSYSPSPSRIGLLSVEQALADYAQIISFIRDSHRAWNSPVVAFGGSLAGTLSAFMRIKYPNIVDMAWSSSSPLRGYPGLGVNQFAWREQVTTNFRDLSPGCPDTIRRGFSALLTASPVDVCSTFKVCGLRDPWHTQPFICETEHPQVVADVQSMAWGVLEGDGEFFYPPASSPIPRHCSLMANGSDGGMGLGVFERLLWQGSAEYISTSPRGEQCLNTTAFTSRADTADAKGWDYLSCTEIVHPIGANNVTDFFPPGNWSIDQLRMYCSSKFGSQHPPRPAWLPLEMGMSNLDHFTHSASRIVFVYGLRDPWHTQAISLTNLSADLPVVTVEDGGHCADMLRESDADTTPMIAARNYTEAILGEWIAQFVTENQP